MVIYPLYSLFDWNGFPALFHADCKHVCLSGQIRVQPCIPLSFYHSDVWFGRWVDGSELNIRCHQFFAFTAPFISGNQKDLAFDSDARRLYFHE